MGVFFSITEHPHQATMLVSKRQILILGIVKSKLARTQSKLVSKVTMQEVLKVLMEQQKAITLQLKEQNRKIEELQRLFMGTVD